MENNSTEIPLSDKEKHALKIRRIILLISLGILFAVVLSLGLRAFKENYQIKEEFNPRIFGPSVNKF